MGQVLVLNASYEPLNVCSVRRAHVLVFKGKAEVLEEHETASALGDRHVRPATRDPARPVRPRSTPEKRKISRRALFARDGWSCVYCGTGGGRLTLDHVVPARRGGDSGWENVVTACAPCNLRKGDRLPEEVSMTMRRSPRRRRRRSSSCSPPRRSCRRPGTGTCRATSRRRRLRSSSTRAEGLELL